MAPQVPTQARDDFLQFLHNREAKLREKTTPDILSNAQHKALRKKLGATNFIPPVWSPTTQKGVVDLAEKWVRYYNDLELGD